MVEISNMVTRVMKFKHPNATQYDRMSKNAKIGYHTSASKMYKQYASFFSGKTHREIMKKYQHHFRKLKNLQKT